MKIDFRKITVENLDGTTDEKDIAQWLGNTIRQHTADIGEDDLACDIYRHGEVEITQREADIIRKYVDKAGLLAYIKRALYAKLAEVENNLQQSEQ